MAFISMLFASIILLVLVIGLGILLIGVILDIIYIVKKRKNGKASKVLFGFAVTLTIWGLLQGVGPIAFVGILNLKNKMDYRAEIADFNEEDIIYMDSSELSDGFDYKGVHYVSDPDLSPQTLHENYKTTNIGAIVYDNDRHQILEKISNDLDANILQVREYSDTYVPKSELKMINDYYQNKAPLYCDVDKNLEDADKEIVKDINSSMVREIRDYLEKSGEAFYREQYEDMDTVYLFFYSFDDIQCIDFDCIETDEGLVAEYCGKAKILPEKYAEYFRSLIK